MPRFLFLCLSGCGWCRRVRRKFIFLFIAAFISLLLIFTQQDSEPYEDKSYQQLLPLENNYLALKGTKGKLIDLPGCTIPVDNEPRIPTHPSHNVPKGKACDFVQPKFTFVQRNTIFLNSTFKDATCCYKGITRIPGSDEDVEWTQECVKIPLAGVEVLLYDATVIICEYGGNIFQDYHAVVRKKEKDFKISNSLADANPNNPPNIIILGIDSVSRSHFHKFMPRTSNLVKELGTFDLAGYIKVGDNTLPNIVPILTGYSLDQISRFCFERTKPIDSCPFLWHNLSMTTAYLEDAPILNMFNLRKFGFLNPPTDYYLRPLMLGVIKESYSIADNSAFHCVGSRSTESFMLEHIEQLMLSAANNHPLFLFSWFTSLAHANPHQLPEADVLFSDLIQRLDLSNTILIVMSDHGYRFGETRMTYNGWFDEKLPFFTITFPDKVKNFLGQERLRVLEENTKKLTTPFDVYQTLTEIMTVYGLKNNVSLSSNYKDRHGRPVPRNHGQSLFSPISPDRTCDAAGVPKHYCPCTDLQPMSLLDPVIDRSVEHVVNKINSWIPRRCKILKILEITAAAKLNEKEFTAGFRTKPGGWQFELVGSFDGQMDSVKFNRISSIHHKTEAWCTKDWEMYCYCDILGLVMDKVYGANNK